MRQYGDVVKMMDQFLHTVEAEKDLLRKQAADDDAKKEPEGKTSETVADAAAGQGEVGKEKAADAAASVGGTPAPAPAAEVKEGDSKEPTDDQGPETLAADEKVEGVKVVETPEKVARANRLAHSIVETIARLQKAAAEQPAPAAPATPAVGPTDVIQKLAAENPELAEAISASYHDFALGWLDGHCQRAEDRREMVQSGLFKSAEEADGMLDMVAMNDPAAVAPPGLDLPPEAAAEGAPAEGIDPESAQVLDEMADQMAAAGVKPEDVVQAAQALEELTKAGVKPEEIVQATQSIAEEDASQAAAPEAAEKVAVERQGVIKDFIRGLRG